MLLVALIIMLLAFIGSFCGRGATRMLSKERLNEEKLNGHRELNFILFFYRFEAGPYALPCRIPGDTTYVKTEET